MEPMPTEIRLSRLPLSAKLLITAFLAFMALNHLFAGWLVWEVSHSAAGSTKEFFQYKTLVYLLRMSHQHAFGHGTMYFLVGGVFLFSRLPEKLKAAAILAPFLGAATDLASWWLLKYGAADYEWLSMTGGILYSLGFAFMSLWTFYELWFFKNNSQGFQGPWVHG